MKRILLMAGIIAAVALAATLMAGVPALMNYQGRLTNSAGTPLDTTIQMIFSFYGDSTGGSPMWADTIGTVTVANGLFNAMLGVYDPGDGSWGNDTIKFFGIAVGGDPEISPRTRLATSLYAFHSGTVASIDSAEGGTIIGDYYVMPSAAKGDASKGSALRKIGGPASATSFTSSGTAPFSGRMEIYSISGATITLDGPTGMTTTQGFTMPTGASYGYLLTSEGSGIGTWEQPAWDFSPMVSPSVIYTHGAWGIARLGNNLWGSNRNTHVNLGDGCTTGRNLVDYGWATISGGQNNQAIGHFTTIGGGYSNIIGNGNVPAGDEARLATIAGGYSNEAHAVGTSIGGGEFNIAYDVVCAIGGGFGNQAGLSGASLTEAGYAYIGGGLRNYAQGYFSTIGGGHNNQAVGLKSTIGGGDSNYVAYESGTIGGGHQNQVINFGPWGTIAGGDSNVVSDSGGAILGGSFNRTSGSFSGIGGGRLNQAGGHCAAIPGGYNNRANGRFSLAAGQQAQALNDGSFVWNDNSGVSFASTNQNQFLIHASGNTGIMTNAPHSTLHDNGSIAVGYKYTDVTYTPATSSDCVIEAHPLLAAPPSLVIDLPTAVGITGRIYTIKNTGGVGTIVEVNAFGLELIDGSVLYNVPSYQWVTIVSNGTKWLIIGN